MCTLIVGQPVCINVFYKLIIDIDKIKNKVFN